MTDYEKMQFIQYMQMKDELDNVAYNGIRLKLDGCFSDAHSIAAMCVFHEESDYLRDYRRDDTGAVAELNFDKVRRVEDL